MNFTKKTRHLKRYKDLAGLLVKYGRSDLVKQMNLDDQPHDPNRPADPKAEELPDDLEKLGPTYVKLGQFLSTRADFLPPEYLDSLSRLQEQVAPISLEEVEKILSNELGMRLSKAFSHFETTPMASASIGQVHFATLPSGRPVAVKIQRPNIREQIFDDLDAFQDIAEFLEKNTQLGKQLMLQATLEEFRKAMLLELDYQQEAQHLTLLAANLKKFKRIIIPLPVPDYSSSRILTMEYIKGKNINKIGPLGLMDIDGKKLANDLFRAYLKQILIDGFFHADPHPGNIYITDTGHLSLIDLGMVGRIPEKIRMQLLRTLLAVGDQKGEKAAEHLLAMGSKEENVNEENFIRQVSEVITRTNESNLQQIEVGRLVLEVTRLSAENGIRLPNEIVMLGKTLLNLDKAGRTLDPEFNPNAAIRNNAQSLMKSKMKDMLKPDNFYDLLLDIKSFTENFPSRINSILKAMALNKFTLRMKIMDEKSFIQSIKVAANRLTAGIILAALIMGAALLMRIDTAFRILGYPALAILFFLLAAIGGLILVFHALFRDK